MELDNFGPIPLCSCEVQCVCIPVPTVESYRESDYVIRFLKGCNTRGLRSQIMIMEELPGINKVFSLLMQQERQLNVSFDNSNVLVNTTENFNGRGRGKARCFFRLWYIWKENLVVEETIKRFPPLLTKIAI